MKKIILLLFTVSCSLFTAKAQSKIIDSLLAIVNSPASPALADTAKVNIFSGLCTELRNIGKNKVAMEYGNKGLALSQKINYKKGEANCCFSMGVIYMNQSDYTKALDYFFKSLKIYEASGNKKAMAKTYSNIGVIYNNQSDYSKALDYYFLSLHINELLGNKSGMADNYGNIGNIYMYQLDYTKALEYYTKTLKIDMESGNKTGIGQDYVGLGIICDAKFEYIKALDYFEKGLTIFEMTNDVKEVSIAQINIGACYIKIFEKDSASAGIITLSNQHISHSSLLDSSLAIHKKALAINKKTGDKYTAVYSLLGIGTVYLDKQNYKEAILYYLQSYTLADSVNALKEKKEAAKAISEAYKKLKEWENAYNWYEKYTLIKDSVFNEAKNKEITGKQIRFEYDKKAVADSVKAGEEKKVISAELKQEQTRSYALYGGLALLIVFGGFMFNRFRVTQKQKNIIEIQKDVVEDKNREITKSIEYALRIQTAILPPTRVVKQYLENSFILYKPKDIVAGDFYWMETVQISDSKFQISNSAHPSEISNLKSEIILFAACDCTGHGVPGAMVSVVCHNALNRAVREFGLTQPAAILDKTAEIVMENFAKSDEDIKDGMDISLVSLEFGVWRTEKNNELQTTICKLNYAGANNPLWIVRKNSELPTPGYELIETKANKQHIGKSENIVSFTNHQYTLKPGDSIYLFTDGFADQFGGESRQKKLTRKRFKEIILTHQYKAMQEQGNALDKFITDYRKEVEQIDDILVMGVRV